MKNVAEELEKLMSNGNWAEAIHKLKNCRITPREFTEQLEELIQDKRNPVEILQDFALLGFYARKPM
jgi:hypothetical protein